jgi:glycine/D-amino acid oxidase-like deaminating enzyme
MAAGEALKVCPVIRAEKFAQALYEPDCMDIDTDALMNGYGRALRRRGSQVLMNSRVGAEAQKTMARIRQIDPELRAARLTDVVPFRGPQEIARYVDGLRRAGLPV